MSISITLLQNNLQLNFSFIDKRKAFINELKNKIIFQKNKYEIKLYSVNEHLSIATEQFNILDKQIVSV